jgi:1,4-alpha-glucan branching enzyme
MITKKFFKSKDTCKITFELPKDVEAKSASVVGDFNNWDPEASPLKKVKGTWKTTLDLDNGREYEYRYLIDGSKWVNDPEADKYIPNNIDGNNCVVVTSNGH